MATHSRILAWEIHGQRSLVGNDIPKHKLSLPKTTSALPDHISSDNCVFLFSLSLAFSACFLSSLEDTLSLSTIPKQSAERHSVWFLASFFRDSAQNTYPSVTKRELGTSLVLQWLRLYTPNTGGWGLLPCRKTRSYSLQLKILHADTKTHLSQINIKKRERERGCWASQLFLPWT